MGVGFTAHRRVGKRWRLIRYWSRTTGAVPLLFILNFLEARIDSKHQVAGISKATKRRGKMSAYEAAVPVISILKRRMSPVPVYPQSVQRQRRRFPIVAQADYIINGERGQAVTQNISNGGVFLKTDRILTGWRADPGLDRLAGAAGQTSAPTRILWQSFTKRSHWDGRQSPTLRISDLGREEARISA